MNDEPELRRDPITGRWALIAPERARRPITTEEHAPRYRAPMPSEPCPFCPGHEQATPPEVLAYYRQNTSPPTEGTSPNGSGWRLRVVPNMYPAVRAVSPTGRPLIRHSGPQEGEHADEFLELRAAIGYAEVLIECPEHVDSPAQLSDEQLGDVFRAYRERMVALAADTRIEHIAIFKNVGAEAGASLAHTHSQIIATTTIPTILCDELNGAKAYFTRTRRCPFCVLVESELADAVRVVARSANFVVVTAFAPRFAYEMWVLPLQHTPRYETITDTAALELASLLKPILQALDTLEDSPAYNWFLHTTPVRGGEPAHYHWHLEILPRTARPGGLEWGFGTHITTVRPEAAALELRTTLPGTARVVG